MNKEYTISDKNVLIVNINRLKKESYLDDNLADNNLRVAVKFIQDTIIEKVIGTCLFNKLRDLICSGEINDCGNECCKDLLDNYLFPIFVYGVPAEITIPISYKNRNNGVVQPNNENLTQTNLNDIKYLNQYYHNKMDYYVDKAIRFLRCNYDCFRNELCNCKCSWCTERAGIKKPSTPLNLNDCHSYYPNPYFKNKRRW